MKNIVRSIIAAMLLLIAASAPVSAQSSPGLVRGQVPTAAQWNSYFAKKQDVLGFPPGNIVLGPASSTLDSLAIFSSTTGKALDSVPLGALGQCLVSNGAGVPPTFQSCSATSSGWTNTRLAKTAAYTAVTGDCGSTIALAGSNFYALTFGAASGYLSTCVFMVVNEDSSAAKNVVLTGTGTIKLYPRQSAIVFNDNNVWQSPALTGAHRYLLTATLNLYVDGSGSNGSDTLNDGLAAFGTRATGPFKTIQKCLNTVANDLDLAGQQVVCNLAAATYAEQTYITNYVGFTSIYGYAQAKVLATNATPANTKIAPTSGVAVFATGNNTPWTFQGMQLCGDAADPVYCVEADSGGVVATKGVRWGTTTLDHILSLFHGSRVAVIEDNESIAGPASVHAHARFGGTFLTQAGLTSVVSGTPLISVLFYADEAGYINESLTFSGTGFNASTQSWVATNNGVIQSNGTTIPGTAGAPYTGGVYNGVSVDGQQGVGNSFRLSNVGTPAVACNAGTPGISGTDTAGVFTAGIGSANCTITFVQSPARANAPTCHVTKRANASALDYTTSTTQISLTAVTASATYDYSCHTASAG